MYGETNPAAAVDPYSDAYNAPPATGVSNRDAPPPRGRSRSRSPARSAIDTNGADRDRERDRSERYKSPPPRRRSPPPSRRPPHAPIAPNPSSVLGVFGLSIRTRERDLDEEFSRFGRVEKVTIVYDQRQSDRSRGFGFIQMSTVDEASRCIKELNGVELNGRRIRVDYSVTDRPHAPTPGEYMGHRRQRDSYRSDRLDRDSYRDSHRDRDRDSRRGGDRDKDRDPYGRDRDWRDRRSPPPRSRYSPDRDYRRRRSYSRSPPPRSPAHTRDYDAAPPSTTNGDGARW